ncbi:MAG: trigger factor [Acidobacteria bacterium]|nr:trigger factor [Acidobacteriota bacterium]
MDVQSEITHLSATQKELVIEAPAEVVRQEFDRTYAVLGRSVKVPGFRPGKVPPSVLKQKFQREARDTVASQLLPEAIRAALAEHRLHLVTDPKIHDLSLQEGQPLRFKATVEVLPHIDVTNYKGLRVTKKVEAVTEEEIDEALEDLCEQHAQLIPVEDRPAEVGDFATMTLSARVVSPTAGEGAKLMRDQVTEIEIGGEDVLKEFSENVKGLQVGETRTFRVTYAPDYHAPRLAGKEVEYQVRLDALRQKEFPKLDDEFPRTIGEDFETLADFRQELRRRLEKQHEEEAEEALNEVVLEQLLQAHPVEVPETLVRRRLESRLTNIARSLAMQGIDPDSSGLDWQAIAHGEREQAIRDVRVALILQQIAERESITVSNAEVDAEIARLAAQRRQSAIQLKGRLTKEGTLDSMKNEMRNRKVLELVVKAAAMEREVVDGET